MSNRITINARCIECRAVFGQPHAGQLRCLDCWVERQARMESPPPDNQAEHDHDLPRYCILCHCDGVLSGHNVCSECMGDMLGEME